MGKTHETITPELAEWIGKQRVFFVGTAPLSQDGHINISPKGGDSFRILGPLEVVYQDYTGSGAETAAHLQENGRIVIMFCAFEGPPKIVRLHGEGTLITPAHPRFAELNALFPDNPGTRAIVHITVNRVSDSCGFSIPYFDFQGERDTLDRWAAAKTPEQLKTYRETKNQKSIDGLPAFTPTVE
jgi:Pyridoxamine 5''-phosphate oxidase.